MFGDKDKSRKLEASAKADAVDTVIGEYSRLEGNIKSEGSIRIDGAVKGNVQALGDVFLGAKADVEGNIMARNLFVGGRLQGEVEVKGRLELNASAKLLGSIRVGNLIIEEGAVFKGDCTTLVGTDSEMTEEGKTNAS